MTLLLLARYVFLAALITVAAIHVWLVRSERVD
jgi:hypothetical protein